MAKKSAVAKQKRRERMVALKWDKRQELKKIIKDPTVSEEERDAAVETLNKMPKNSCPTRLRNRCQVTGRPRGNYRKFGISRIVFRDLASRGVIPGVTKASW